MQAPGGGARNLNQGLSNSCTCHALANAIAHELDKIGIDVVQEHIVSVLVTYNQHAGRAFPHNFDSFEEPILTMDQLSEEWIQIRIETVKEIANLEDYTPDKSHVLAYYTRQEIDVFGETQWYDYHCVFVKGKIMLQGNAFKCINSWGDYDRNPVVPVNRFGNRLWVVQVKCEKAPKGLFLCI